MLNTFLIIIRQEVLIERSTLKESKAMETSQSAPERVAPVGDLEAVFLSFQADVRTTA